MVVRVESLRPQIGFAHRGARSLARENTLEAFRLAVELGATGLESDVWVTADGVPVLDHDGVVGRFPRRRPMSEVLRSELPSHVPSLAEFYDEMGTEHEFSLDVKDVEALPAVLGVAADAGGSALARLWLCHYERDVLVGCRAAAPDSRIVDSCRGRTVKEGHERRAADLARLGIDAVNMHETDWKPGMVATYHRFGRYALAWDAQSSRVIAKLAIMGIDGIFSDHVDRLAEVLGPAEPG